MAVFESEGIKSTGADRLLGERRRLKRKKARTDWRKLLRDFIQEEISNYSFSPPDKRYGDSEFFLPDFNQTELTVSDILFMIDTSASMTDEEVMAAYSEFSGAVEQFHGRIEGWVGFF